MRKGMEPDLLEHEGKVVGINLSSDCVSEHEHGIRDVQAAFGLPILEQDKNKILGMKARQITKIPKGFWFGETSFRFGDGQRTGVAIVYDSHIESPEYSWKDRKPVKVGPNDETRRAYVNRLAKRELDLLDHEWDDEAKKTMELLKPLAAAWDEHSFGVHTPKEMYGHFLDVLYKSFQEHDVAIKLGGGGPFQNAGLCLLIASKLPKSLDEEVTKADEDSMLRRKLEAESGLEEFLKKAGKEWIALHIHHFDKETGAPMWILNPYHQDRYNWGFYTEADLRLWAEDKGPVVTKTKSESKG